MPRDSPFRTARVPPHCALRVFASLVADETNRAEMDFYDDAEALFWKQYYDKKAFNKLRMRRFDFDVGDSSDGTDESFM